MIPYLWIAYAAAVAHHLGRILDAVTPEWVRALVRERGRTREDVGREADTNPMHLWAWTLTACGESHPMRATSIRADFDADHNPCAACLRRAADPPAHDPGELDAEEARLVGAWKVMHFSPSEKTPPLCSVSILHPLRTWDRATFTTYANRCPACYRALFPEAVDA